MGLIIHGKQICLSVHVHCSKPERKTLTAICWRPWRQFAEHLAREKLID